MTEQERKDTEEITHVLCNEDISCGECRDILQNRCIDLDRAETLRDIGYQKVSEGDIIIHKDLTKRTEEEIEWLVNHNKDVREEVIYSLRGLLEGYVHTRTGENLFVHTCKKFGVEIKDKKYLGGIS